MGDFATLLTSLNLSPVNTVLLALLLIALKYFDGRLSRLEASISRQSQSISWIKGHIDGDEEDD